MPRLTNTENAVENLGPSIGYRPEDRSRYERLLSYLNISKRILRRRFELGLSQEALGKAAQSKQSKVSEIELMKGNPRLDTLDRIARALGLVVDLVPIEDSLRGSPFARPTLTAASALSGVRQTGVAEEELVAAGTAAGGFDGFAAPWTLEPRGGVV